MEPKRLDEDHVLHYILIDDHIDIAIVIKDKYQIRYCFPHTQWKYVESNQLGEFPLPGLRASKKYFSHDTEEIKKVLPSYFIWLMVNEGKRVNDK